MSSSQSEQRLLAEQKENEYINLKGVLKEVQLPRGKRPMRTKWVYNFKHRAQGKLKSFKLRLVAYRYAQVFDINFYETYSPVARLTSLRILFVIAA